MQPIDIEDLLNDDVFESIKTLNVLNDEAKIVEKMHTSKHIKYVSKAKLKKVYDHMVKRNMICYNEIFDNQLINKNNRMKSGVLVVTIYTKPYKCSGQCLFCPTEPDMPKSYLTTEPLGFSAKNLDFDPIKQINNRLNIMKMNKNVIDKLEILIVGGSWLQYQIDYQFSFMNDIVYAINTYGDVERRPKLSLIEEQNINKDHVVRISGITIETRPDDINPTTIINLRRLGCTRVQIGVQHVDNHILELNKRGHTVETSIYATKLLKEAGFKVDHHYMLNLYGSDVEKDIEMFKVVFTNPSFQPDQIKIYPCFVNQYADLYELYQHGLYKSYDNDTLRKCIIDIKTHHIPFYVRINRILRDFPKESIVSGSHQSGMRDKIKREMKFVSTKCKCIRCRELGMKNFDPTDVYLDTIEYEASNGKEYFISYVNNDKTILYGFLRLRINYSTDIVFDELKNASIIRELHVYGKLQNTSKCISEFSAQNNGLGSKLLQHACNITLKNNIHKITVISSIGVKKYYEKRGFVNDGLYMSKHL